MKQKATDAAAEAAANEVADIHSKQEFQELEG